MVRDAVGLIDHLLDRSFAAGCYRYPQSRHRCRLGQGRSANSISSDWPTLEQFFFSESLCSRSRRRFKD
jgi:hypothetical protein